MTEHRGRDKQPNSLSLSLFLSLAMSSSSKSNRKKNIIRNTVVVKIGCGCRRPKLADVFRPRPKAKTPSSHHHQKPNVHASSSTTTSSYDDETTTTTTNTITNTTASFSHYLDSTTPPTHSEAEQEAAHYDTKPTTNFSDDSNMVKGFGRISESVAVVKDSDDPYLDFRQSMLQMILEKEIYSREDLRDLLDCFLQLNSPYHHEIIVRAFSEIWNGIFSIKTTPVSSSSSHGTLPSETTGKITSEF
ncbi:transcription repressor OFP8-like [Macadamia integrifolia]|uniref:transcription repressor OFP8-like n=1 Tax=Macadamia integrifolia TaxID=60698 RepID=UPI001C52728D|nr:transcription repressor OFP8-like [Macadamia integrifolia]